METKELIEAFKNAEGEIVKDNPVVINEEMMYNVHGGAKSAGHVCTISGECNSGGESCGGAIRDAIEGFLRMFW